ncbi:LysE/ArgO family amino acid transporter [Chryseomicrobium palamuruense]|uniref:LysE/ArgO family amino acid transporter n=1 Tax=Chryseomicrobium palamuruense TaxID=682973 RepID=A0ABV8USN1_9BACL
MEPILHGVALAFGLILPLGVQNVFIFTQGATQKKFSSALPAIVTASICDTLLITLAITGVSVIVLTFEWLRTSLFLIGFLFLLYMGWVMWKAKPAMHAQQPLSHFTAKRQIAFAASVSLLNPHAILDTIGVIGTSALIYAGTEKWLFSLSVIIVSWIWFFSLALAGRKLGKMDTSGQWLRRINKVSAVVIWVMAFYILSHLI